MAGSGSTLFDVGLFQLLFHNDAAGVAGIGDATGLRNSSVAGGLYVSLHSAAPGKAGDQSTNELTYGSYARVGLPRASTSWHVLGAAGAPATARSLTAAQFPADDGASAAQTATHVGIGAYASGTGYLLLSAPLAAPVVVTAGIIPLFASAAIVVTAD